MFRVGYSKAGCTRAGCGKVGCVRVMIRNSPILCADGYNVFESTKPGEMLHTQCVFHTASLLYCCHM